MASINADLLKKLALFRRTLPDRFLGEISTVDQHQRTVWINLGSSDGLEPQVTFSVYSGDVTNVAKATNKAAIEVTKITGEHEAMARILEDNATDPIVRGDKIFTPLWSPGQQKHFALVGFLDLNGDGKNDHEGVKRLITLNRGVVDCDVNDKGTRTGKMTVNTDYLVCGDQPPEKGSPEAIHAYTDMVSEAARLNVPMISLAKLKEQMGYRNPPPAKRYAHFSIFLVQKPHQEVLDLRLFRPHPAVAPHQRAGCRIALQLPMAGTLPNEESRVGVSDLADDRFLAAVEAVDAAALGPQLGRRGESQADESLVDRAGRVVDPPAAAGTKIMGPIESPEAEGPIADHDDPGVETVVGKELLEQDVIAVPLIDRRQRPSAQ